MDCAVCGADASGLYYDARLQTCFACRVFFRRTAIKSNLPLCINLNQNCAINIENRTACKYCRYQKCIDIGMSPTSISKMGIKEVEESPRLEEIQPEENIEQVMSQVMNFLESPKVAQIKPLKCISSLIDMYLPMPLTLAEEQYIQSLVQVEQQAFDEVVLNEPFRNDVAKLFSQDIRMLSLEAIQHGVNAGYEKWTRFANNLGQFCQLDQGSQMTLLSTNMKLIRFLELAEFLHPSLNGNQQLQVLFRSAFTQTYPQLPVLAEKVMTVETIFPGGAKGGNNAFVGLLESIQKLVLDRKTTMMVVLISIFCVPSTFSGYSKDRVKSYLNYHRLLLYRYFCSKTNCQEARMKVELIEIVLNLLMSSEL